MRKIRLILMMVILCCSCSQSNIEKETETDIIDKKVEEKEKFLSAIQISDMFINAYQNMNIEKMESFLSEDYYIEDEKILNSNNDFKIPIIGYQRAIDDIVLNGYSLNTDDGTMWIQYHIRSYETNQTFLLGITLEYRSYDWIIINLEVS
ncbi:hypothetical protein [Fusibacter ferrireducens]|uniref:DUF4829 domain-containing protein n=1 Tax=Fusibacter ferrireducens TaxID=2785058 RepID=A0ABS0A096_9FIRM|nr:hypothetical protein [Fusibacter ferrireducens]MBF4696110.1 hypothetical protein [Fusibacter ferrireducens]